MAEAAGVAVTTPARSSPTCWIYTAADVRALLDMDAAIESQRAAFEALSLGVATMPPKVFVPDHDDGASAFSYMARVGADTGMTAKFGSVHPRNGDRGLPSIAALITLLDPVAGHPVAVMDGSSVTAIRTAAASAVAFDVLAPPRASQLAVLGTGVQGVNHVRATSRIRPLQSVRLWSPDQQQCETAAQMLRSELGLEVTVASTPEGAVDSADLVALCTLSHRPVIDRAWLRPGATVISVGSFETDRCEVDDATISEASPFVVDHLETALGHAGPVVQGLERSLITVDQLTEIGDYLTGKERVGRRNPDDVVLYNSTGVAVQDASAAWAIHERARERDIGTPVSW